MPEMLQHHISFKCLATGLHVHTCTKQPPLTWTFSYLSVSSSVGVMAKIARLWAWTDNSNKNSPLNFQRTSMVEPDVADVWLSCVLHL